MNKELDVQRGKELPKKVSGDNALLILDRSTILQQLEDYTNSSRDLETAELPCPAGQLGALRRSCSAGGVWGEAENTCRGLECVA